MNFNSIRALLEYFLDYVLASMLGVTPLYIYIPDNSALPKPAPSSHYQYMREGYTQNSDPYVPP